jgi:hypothetical protein
MEMKRNGDTAAGPAAKTQRKTSDQLPAAPLAPAFAFFPDLAASYHASNTLQEALVKMSRDITQESKKARVLLSAHMNTLVIAPIAGGFSPAARDAG